MFTPKSVGIELTDDNINIVCLQAGPAGLKVSAQERIALSADKAGVHVASAGAHIKDFMDRHGLLGSTEVFLCIPTDLTVTRTIELPLALRENLHETLGYELEKYVPFPVESVYFDALEIKEDRKNNTFAALLTVIKKSSLDPFLALPTAIGNISGIQDTGCALANATAYLENVTTQQNLAILFDNGSTINLALMHGKRLQYAREWQATANITEELTRELTDLHKQTKNNNEPLQLIVCGPRAETDLMPAAKNIHFAPQILNIQKSGLSSPELLPAFGAALMGFDKASTPVNLLPPTLRKKPNRMGLYLFFILFIMTLIAGIAWGGSHMMRQQLMADKLDDELSRLRAEAVKIEDIRDETNTLTEQIQALNTLATQRISVLSVLRELTRGIPETAWLRSLSIKNKSVILDGFAESATELIPILETSPMFEDVIFKSTITKRRDGKEIFKIALNIRSEQSLVSK